MAESAKHTVAGSDTVRSGNSGRRLALEVRSRRFAFVVLQKAVLLDWGNRRYAAGPIGVESALKTFRFLLQFYAPAVIAARQTRRVPSQSSDAAKSAIHKLRVEAKRHSVRFEIVNRRQMRRYFLDRNCRNKYQIAQLIIHDFPELKRIAPRQRRPWDPESYSAAIFDAIATAVVHEGRLLSDLSDSDTATKRLL